MMDCFMILTAGVEVEEMSNENSISQKRERTSKVVTSAAVRAYYTYLVLTSALLVVPHDR